MRLLRFSQIGHNAKRTTVVMSQVQETSERSLELRSTARTASLLDCSVRTVYRLVGRGELRPVRLGRVLRFELDEIQRYLERHREPAP